MSATECDFRVCIFFHLKDNIRQQFGKSALNTITLQPSGSDRAGRILRQGRLRAHGVDRVCAIACSDADNYYLLRVFFNSGVRSSYESYKRLNPQSTQIYVQTLARPRPQPV